MSFVSTALEQLGDALKQFGNYSFDDKGPEEVMYLSPLTKELRKLTPKNAAKELLELASSPKYDGRGLILASRLVEEMEDWEELFDQEGINDIYNCTLPAIVKNHVIRPAAKPRRK